MPTNDIKTIAGSGGANVISQAAYTALTSFLSNGYGSGIVDSNQFNKVIRQSSLMAYSLAQYIVNQSGNDVLDNGDPATVIANLLAAVQRTAGAQTDAYEDVGVSANTFVIAPSPSIAAYRNYQIFAVHSERTITGPATLNAGPGAITIKRRDGSALQANDIVAGQPFLVMYLSGTPNVFLLLGVAPSDYLDSPAFRNNPTAPTQAPLTNNTRVASTAYADAAVAAALTYVAPQVMTANFSAGPSGDLWINTTAGAFTCTLPDPPSGSNPLTFHDVSGTWATNNFTVAPGTKVILGPYGLLSGNLICDVSGESFRLWYDGTNWRME